ncbi:MAG: 3-hydroxyacyl-CoA dehydrogenase NAD-binding domain-containing protein [Acidobacteriota bacterium]
MSCWRFGDTLERDGFKAAVLLFDREDRELNVIDEEVLDELETRLDELKETKADALLVGSGKSQHFCAGADVDLIASIDDAARGAEAAARGQAVLGRLRRLSIPTIAVINGACVGGGTELALWCWGRVASTDDAVRIGLPEVKLGIVPGFGGTQLLPRVVGLKNALTLASTGRLVPARTAKRLGLVDAVVEEAYLFAEAFDRARALAKSRQPPAVRSATHLPGVADLMLAVARNQARKVAGPHYPAPDQALRLCRKALSTSLKKGCQEEARQLGRLLVTPTCRSLLHVNDLQRKAPKGTAPDERAGVAVLGAGVMGSGIAGVTLAAGHPARLCELDPGALSKGVNGTRKVVDRALRRRASKTRHAAHDRLSWSLGPSGLQSVDLVVEAIVEDEGIKKKVLAGLEEDVTPDCLLATNTSSLSVTSLATALQRPERFLGIHFFNPVPKMPLVEVIPGPDTSPETMERGVGWVRALKKVPVVVADSPGFLVNRILMPYLAEALRLHGEGVSVEDVDKAAQHFGMPMGPFRLLDEVGLDVASKVAATFAAAFPGRFAAAPVLDQLVKAGRLGKKNGKGFYDYRKGRRRGPWSGLPDAENQQEREHLQDRLILRMANEGLLCLEEQVAARPDDVDLATVFGLGFPPFRGGLHRHVETVGASRVRDRLLELAELEGPRFSPCTYLNQMSESES